MSQFPSVSNPLASATSEDPFGSSNSLNDLDLDDFLDLMIAELQNQDPLNPLENDELIAQISQIREVGATDKLTSTLDAVLLGQNITSATNLIGADIEALSDDSQRISGVVDRISVTNGRPKLHLDLNPSAAVDETPGNLEQGNYQYRVVWQEDGTLLGVDPLEQRGGSVDVDGLSGNSVLITNLPESRGTKQVYRTDSSGTGEFRLVGAISDSSQSSFLDTTGNAALGNVLAGQPQLLRSERSFTVSLENVAEIRPPSR